MWWTPSLRSPGAAGFVPVEATASRTFGTIVRAVDGSGEKYVSTVYEVSRVNVAVAVRLSRGGAELVLIVFDWWHSIHGGCDPTFALQVFADEFKRNVMLSSAGEQRC